MNEWRRENIVPGNASPETTVITGDQIVAYLQDHTEEELNAAGVRTQRMTMLDVDDSWKKEMQVLGLDGTTAIGTTLVLDREEWVVVENQEGDHIGLALREQLEEQIREANERNT